MAATFAVTVSVDKCWANARVLSCNENLQIHNLLSNRFPTHTQLYIRLHQTQSHTCSPTAFTACGTSGPYA
eukprot:482416-Lingulodinium_polyedra.AAC.1